LIIDGVECTLEPDKRRPDGGEGWRGEAWVPTDIVLLPGEPLTLESSRGWKAQIEVQRVMVDGSAGKMLVRFTGTQPLGSAEESA
jgi:hypothetical protein